MNSSHASDSKEDKKQTKNNIKLKANDEAWGAPNAKPFVLLSEKVDRYLQQKVPNEVEIKMMGEWIKKWFFEGTIFLKFTFYLGWDLIKIIN